MEFQEKSCQNCQHFERHYIKGNTRLKRTAFGHCKHPKKHSHPPKVCQYWEWQGYNNIKEERSKRFERLDDAIKEMAFNLEEIKLLLAELTEGRE